MVERGTSAMTSRVLVACAVAVGVACAVLAGCQSPTEESELSPVTCSLSGESQAQMEVLPGQSTTTSVAGATLAAGYATSGIASGDLAFSLVVTSEEVEVYRALYQFDGSGSQLSDAPFHGGHGFTGLSYLPLDSGQVQFYCATSGVQDSEG